MENRKDIGKAFKDKLANLDKAPSDGLWNSIEKNLESEKKKRRFLIWFFPSILFIGVMSSVLLVNNPKSEKNTFQNITDGKNKEQKKPNNKTQQDPTLIKKNKTTDTNQQKPKQGTKKNKQQDKTTIKKIRTEKLISQTKKTIIYNNKYEEYEVVKKYKITVKKQTQNTTKKNNYNKKATYYKNKKAKTSNYKSKANLVTHKQPITTEQPIITKQEIIENQENIEKPSLVISKKDSITTTEKDTIKPQKSQLTLEKKSSRPKKEFKKDSLKLEPEKENDYSVTFFYGPTIFGSLKHKSIINQDFDNVKKKHTISYYYGLYFKTKYNRFGFSGGVSKINLTLKSKLDSNNLITNYSNIDLNFENNQFSINNKFQSNSNINLEQELTYYEMPLEVYYTLNNLESPFNIDLFTGISLLYLDKNTLSLMSNENSKTTIGSINNILKMNISYNIGLSMNYKLNNHYYITCNPIFKQYIATFNEKNNSKPYSFAIQSGLTYKF